MTTGLIILLVIFAVIGFLWHKLLDKSNGHESRRTSFDPESVLAIAQGLEAFFNRAARPTDLLTNPEFQKAVEILSQPTVPHTTLISYYLGANTIVSCMALEALGQRRDEKDLLDELTTGINTVWYWPREFVLRALDQRYRTPIVGRLFTRLDETWHEPVPLQMVRDFVRRRVPNVESLSWDGALDDASPKQLETIEKLLGKLELDELAPLAIELADRQRQSVDIELLRSFGEVWTVDSRPQHSTIIEHEYLISTVLELQDSFQHESPGSVMLVGESGVGKSAILDVLSRELTTSGWVVFRCNAANVLSGQAYLGQLEERVRNLVKQLHRKRIVWIVPNIHELAWAGTHQFSQTSVLDMLMPYIEQGSIILIGETRPSSYDRLLQHRPQLRAKFSRLTVRPLGEQETYGLALEWSKAQARDQTNPILTIAVLEEAMQLADQYLGSKESPGNVMDFLKSTWGRVATAGGSRITVDDLLVTLAAATGLPLSILDERQELDFTGLEEFFRSRVFGQPEAIECMAERIALIKAGLTDPTRPQGVFLFAGPTGTGKTELAKTVAEYLFGSPDRMIRLDMSEFQTPESLNRILGEPTEQVQTNSLVDQIRHQPFSVVLLDEIEKANPNVWDLFLQVFDDGRLTDRRGNTSDFRHALMIMTTNIGSAIPTGYALGFEDSPLKFSPEQVEKAIRTSFRREFLNRIDQIIVFRPLTRAVMRDLLQKELHRAFTRRGLRRREWAIEWDETALEFLLTKGFTTDLGARPLVRAIERHLLTPLAQTIVRHQFPEGDQFLYVRSDGERILVEFIDPDADAARAEPSSVAVAPPDHFSLQRIILSPQGSDGEVAFLVNAVDRLRSAIEVEEWAANKAELLERSSSEKVWATNERFEILGKVELMDRIEQGLRTANGLLARLSPHDGSRKRSASVLSLCSQQVYLLDAAMESLRLDAPRDAYLLVEMGKSNNKSAREAAGFAKHIGAMYERWAEKRKMSATRLEESGGTGNTTYRLLLAVSGFGAFHILHHENGLHVLEVPREGKSFDRLSVSVRVVPQPVRPLHGRDVEVEAVLRQFRAAQGGRQRIVRRYRERPSPLVRDDIRGWRTGRLDAVLDGDFDLMAGV